MSLPAPLRPLDALTDAWRTTPAGARLDAVRAAALRLKDAVHAGPTVRSVRTYDLITLPYPTRYGLSDAARSLFPYLLITNRMQLCTVATDDGVKRVLVNPSDWERDQETPFFKRAAKGLPPFVREKIVTRRHGDVPARLAEAGVRGDQIDFVTFDHLHTQDLRRLLGEWCPRARLLVQREELEIFQKLHPLQNDWYLAAALDGIARERIVVLEQDVWIGDGLALVRTPGHTLGNHSIVMHTDRGVWTVSENGVSCDNYVPEKSAIKGVAGYARGTGCEVVLNANTREHSLDQYTSMVLEKTLADPCPDGSGFVQHFPSSELTASALLPGLGPTYSHRAIEHGPPPA
jgi:glyoxylase-like metal-dependent hydrolase (beta-lactamase superfamily II)